jgi:hypothetical protein
MKIKEIVLGIAIIILTIFVTFYGISTIFPKPEYNNFCTASEFGAYPAKIYPGVSDQNCTFSRPLQDAYDSCISNSGIPVFNYDNKGCSISLKECNYCQKEFDSAMKIRSRNVFFIALPLGVAIIALGAFIFGLEAVGAGLMGGGIGTLIYGSGAYWPYTENWIRFLISLAGLILIIWLAYFFSKRFGKRKRKR